jgi:tight adherence protein C
MGPWLGGRATILVCALVLSLAGMGMIAYSARMTQAAIGRRIDLVHRPARRSVVVTPAVRPLVRSGGRELDEVEHEQARETAEVVGKFGIPLTGARAIAAAVFAALGLTASWHFLPESVPRVVCLAATAAFAIAGWFVPAMVVSRQVKARTKAVVRGLPDALELLVICSEAGLSFDDGIDRIVGSLRQSQPALAEELALTSADLKILPNREVALANLAERIDVPSVRSVVTTLTQTLRYGTPLAQALRLVASQLRNDTVLRLEERANALPTLMTIPMILFIMPTIFMVIAGPAVLRVLTILHH